MHNILLKRFLNSCSDNRKSKIKNLKLVGCLAILLLFAGWVRMAEAQQAGKVPRVGYLDPSTASGSAVLTEAFRQELSKLGWVEGKNITIEYRFAEYKGPERLKELAADLVRLKLDLIVVTTGVSGLAAKGATTTIPIVMAHVNDPIAVGMVASLAHPGEISQAYPIYHRS